MYEVLTLVANSANIVNIFTAVNGDGLLGRQRVSVHEETKTTQTGTSHVSE